MYQQPKQSNRLCIRLCAFGRSSLLFIFFVDDVCHVSFSFFDTDNNFPNTMTYIRKTLLAFILVMADFTIAFRAPENPIAVKPLVVVRKPTKAVVPDPPITGVDDSLDTTISKEKLMEVGKTIASQKFVKPRRATQRKKWGVENDESDRFEYWSDRRIHTFGNTGFLGALHAAMAPLSTKVIDMVAYDGQDVRSLVRCPIF
jgi:hypothetical protein